MLFVFEDPKLLYTVGDKEKNGVNKGFEQGEDPGSACGKEPSKEPYKSGGYTKLNYAENVVSDNGSAVIALVCENEAFIKVEVDEAGYCSGNEGAKPNGADTLCKCVSPQSCKQHMQQPECQKIYRRGCAG